MVELNTPIRSVAVGGLLGGIATIYGAWAIGSQLNSSLITLSAVAIPLGYTLYKLYTPSKSPVTTTNNSGRVPLDELKEKSERWNEEATINPAFPPGQGPNRNTSISQQSQTNSNPPGAQREPEQPDESSDGLPNDPGSQSPDFSEMEYQWATETDVSFDDVGGMDDLKDGLRTEVLKPLITHREKAEELGVSAPNIIFHGPPGTGKTYMAKALATELGLPFAQLSGADLQSKWINESATKVKTLFEEAKDVAATEGGAVVFLDELDSVLKDRSDSGGSHEEDRKVVNEFLNHLEDTKDHNIVFVGATNRIDALDEAGIRSGRIDKKIHVGLPDTDAREAILRAQLDDRQHELTQYEIDRLAIQTEGVVAADLELVVNNAAKQVLARDGDKIQMADLQKTITT